MSNQTLVETASIQSKRITEIRDLLDVDKTFSYYISGLKKQLLEKDNVRVDEPNHERHNINVNNQRVASLGTNPTFEYTNYYTQTQKWLGVITEINDDFFVAKLEDLNIGGTYEIAEFSFSEVSKEDEVLLKLGNVFYWSVGYANDKGQIKKESLVRFQRLPAWSAVELDEVFDKVNAQNKVSKWL